MQSTKGFASLLKSLFVNCARPLKVSLRSERRRALASLFEAEDAQCKSKSEQYFQVCTFDFWGVLFVARRSIFRYL